MSVTPVEDILVSDEFQQDLAVVQDLIYQSLGSDIFFDEPADPFIFAIAHLLCINRYYIRHLPEVKDIDLTPFFDVLRREIGETIPITQVIPDVELLRENKRWFGHKNTEVIYQFIGQLIGSRIDITYPKDLLFKLSSSRSCLSGAMTNSGELPFRLSKKARIVDGVFWSEWVYVVNVLDAQDVLYYDDLFNLLASIHPAGLREYVYLYFNWITKAEDADMLPVISEHQWEEISEAYNLGGSWPTLDNGWILSKPDVRLSFKNSTPDWFVFSVIEDDA